MSDYVGKHSRTARADELEVDAAASSSPGKRTMVEQAYSNALNAPVQRSGAQEHYVASRTPTPEVERPTIQALFGSRRGAMTGDATLPGLNGDPTRGGPRSIEALPMVQLKRDAGDAPSLAGGARSDPGSLASTGDPRAHADPRWIVSDDASTQPGQLTKTAFLALLRTKVTETASRILGPTWSAASCPDLQRIFSHYADLDARNMERIMQHYGRLTSATSAVQYITAACARMGSAIARWGRGENLSWELDVSGLPGALEAGSVPVVPPTPVAASAVQLQQASAGPTATVDPATDLGAGVAMDSRTAARMGEAFGESFTDTRIHTESVAASKTRELGAMAMAMGTHVAFAPGEYRPGTRSGDALLAHELAHVVQQRGSAPVVQARSIAVDASSDLERDADSAATAVVARLHSGGSAKVPIRPTLDARLRVQLGNRPETSGDDGSSGNEREDQGDDDQKPTAEPESESKGERRVFQTKDGEWGHDYSLRSLPLPTGLTPDEANDVLQRFNAPTVSAMHGDGNDPKAKEAWVADPVTSLVPIGKVTVEHGEGVVTNTTVSKYHPLEGTITRSLSKNDDGTLSIVTEGHGEGGYPITSMHGLMPEVQREGHQMNVEGINLGPIHIPGGPEVFEKLDKQALAYAQMIVERKNDEHKNDEHKNDEHKNDEHKNDEHKNDEHKNDEHKNDKHKNE
jgi:uncharacterized protein DUF4157